MGDGPITEYLETWVFLRTSETTQVPYGEAFVNGILVSSLIVIETIRTRQRFEGNDGIIIERLRGQYTLENLERSNEIEIGNVLNRQIEEYFNVNVYYVGQGNCSAICNGNNQPLIYFDVGGGSNFNRHTYPQGFTLCHTNFPPIILSHWDEDHCMLGLIQMRSLRHKWIAPASANIRPSVQPIARTLYNRGNLLLWPNGLPAINFHYGTIEKCNGLTPNDSGLVLFVHYNGYSILLPGDCGYNEIINLNNYRLTGLVARHHGARDTLIAIPQAFRNGKIAYSFGCVNYYNHPNRDSIRAHDQAGWRNKRGTPVGNITFAPEPNICSTPCGHQCRLQIVQNF
jgi:hypothetical protein